MKNRNIIIIILILILGGIGLLLYNNILSFDFYHSEYSEYSDSLNSQFKNGKKIGEIPNFSNMTNNEKKKEITNLALSIGYENVTKEIFGDGFEVWLLQNDSSNHVTSIELIVNLSSGEIATNII